MENDILAFATCESCKELCDLLTPSPTTKWGFHILWSGWMHGINSWNVKMNVFNIKIRFRAIEIKKWSFYNNLILTKSDIWVLSIENHNYPYQQQYDICVSFRHGKRSIFPIAPFEFSPMREKYPPHLSYLWIETYHYYNPLSQNTCWWCDRAPSEWLHTKK